MYHYPCALTQHTDYALSNCQPCKLGDRKTTNCHRLPWQPSTDSRHNPHQRAAKPPRHPDTSTCQCDNPYYCHLHRRRVGVCAEISENTAINSFFCNAEFEPAVGEPHVYYVCLSLEHMSSVYRQIPIGSIILTLQPSSVVSIFSLIPTFYHLVCMFGDSGNMADSISIYSPPFGEDIPLSVNTEGRPE